MFGFNVISSDFGENVRKSADRTKKAESCREWTIILSCAENRKLCDMALTNMSAPPRRCWVGNAASSVCAVGQRTHPAEVQSEPHLPSDVVLGQLVTERIGLENGIVLSFSS